MGFDQRDRFADIVRRGNHKLKPSFRFAGPGGEPFGIL